MALDPKDVYEFEMSHETGSSKNKLKVTTKFKVCGLMLAARACAACSSSRRLSMLVTLAPCCFTFFLRPIFLLHTQVERKYEPIKVLGHGASAVKSWRTCCGVLLWHWRRDPCGTSHGLRRMRATRPLPLLFLVC